jgi:hypothetical protein
VVRRIDAVELRRRMQVATEQQRRSRRRLRLQQAAESGSGTA